MNKKIAIIDKDDEYLMYLKKGLNDLNNEIHITTYNNINEFKKDSKYEMYDLILIDSRFKTKIEKCVQLSESKENKNSIYKYNNIKIILNEVYKNLYKDIQSKDENKFAKNILFYDVSKNVFSKRCINKFIKIFSDKDKSFVWIDEMFDNLSEQAGMDLIGALYNKTFLNNEEFDTKAKRIDENIYSFYPLKNKMEYLYLKKDDIKTIYNKIAENKFKNIFVSISDDVDERKTFFIDNAKDIYIIYDQDNLNKKEQVKLFFEQYIKANRLDINVFEFKTDENDKKDNARISNLVNK